MQKNQDVFQYFSYSSLLNDHFIKLSTKNPSYSLRAFARDTDISVGYLSKVINKKCNLSLENGQKIFKKLGYNKEELEYIENLIIYNTSHDEDKKQQAYSFLEERCDYLSHKQNEKKDLVIQSVEHFLIYTVIKQFPDEAIIVNTLLKLGISNDDYEKKLNELIDQKYVYRQNRELLITDNDYIIFHHNELHIFHELFTEFILKNIIKKKTIDHPESTGHGLVLRMDDQSLKEAHDSISFLKRKLFNMAQKVNNPKYISFYSSSLYALEVEGVQ